MRAKEQAKRRNRVQQSTKKVRRKALRDLLSRKFQPSPEEKRIEAARIKMYAAIGEYQRRIAKTEAILVENLLKYRVEISKKYKEKCILFRQF